MKKQAISNEELVAIIDTHRRNSLGDTNTELSNERAAAMDHYHGRPYGDEQEGRSAIVSKDLSETVDWIMPPIMSALTQQSGVCEFSPVNEGDEDAAAQESDYVNHVIMKDNDGWLIIHDWVKDALLLKNGYVKHFWDESEKVTEEEYEGLSQIELTKMLGDLIDAGNEVEIMEAGEADDDGDFDVKLKITRKRGRVCIEAIPTEELRISKRTRYGVQSAPFVEHFTLKTRSELIEMGMSPDFINGLPASSTGYSSDQQNNARSSVVDESDRSDKSVDKSMDELDYAEAYIKVDCNGDGVAELRKVVTVANKIPPGDEWNEVVDTIPITSLTTKRVPHRHIGESLDDDLSDLQRIKTVLTRQLLDNVYLTNNAEYIVNNRVHLPDFMESLPGGVKRVNDDLSVTGAVEAIQVQPIIGQLLPAINYIDGVKDGRTGINELSTNIDPDILKNSTKGAYTEAVSRASQKVEMIIRMIAETGLKELVLRVHELLTKHQDKDKVVKLRGRWVPINPREWTERNDMTVRVGLGTGTEEERRLRLGLIAQLTEQAKEYGLIGPQQAYNLFDDFAEALGTHTASRYVMDPQGEEYQRLQQAMASQPPPPNPLAEVEQIKGEFALQREDMKAQYQQAIDQMAQERQQSLEMMKIQVDNANKDADRISKEVIEAAKLEIQAMIAGMKVDIGKPGLAAGLTDE